MIHLMLDTHREHAVGRQLEHLSALVLCANRDFGRPDDLVVIPGHREAALFALGLALRRHDLRIDENSQLVARFADIDHQHPLVHVDLRRGQSYARRAVHGLRQVGDEFADVRGDRSDRRGDLSQPGIGVLKNVQNHKCLQNTHSGCRINPKPLFCGGLGRLQVYLMPPFGEASCA